jgi:hypothetical protein
MHKIHHILSVPVLIDAAAVGSRAHRPWLWWTNLAPAELLQSAVGRIKRADVYVSDILDLHRAEPRRALPMLVSFARSYAFKDNRPGLVWDSTTHEMVEPNADERERAMDFPTDTTDVPGFSEHQ